MHAIKSYAFFFFFLLLFIGHLCSAFNKGNDKNGGVFNVSSVFLTKLLGAVLGLGSQMARAFFEKMQHFFVHFSAELRPMHLDGVPLERNGSLNTEYRREILLGPNDDKLHNAENHEDESLEQIQEQIRRMFKIADTNADGYLSREELQKQIENNAKRHLEDAKVDSENFFQTVDDDGNGISGKISWNEYRQHMEEMTGESEKHRPRDATLRRKWETEKELFNRADAEQDGLDEVEWLGFRHPEYSDVLRKNMVDELLRDHDRNGDGKLTADEFISNLNGVSDQVLAAQRHDFRTLIDRDGDGFADMEELQRYVDPRNPQRTADEVMDIFTLFDGDRDNRLSLEELLARADMLGMSGFVHANIRLHDDL